MSRSITEGLIPTIKLVNLSTRGRTELPPNAHHILTPNVLYILPKQHGLYRALRDFSDPRRKQKLESVENIPAFLRRSDIGQFVTCDELISPWCQSAAAVNHVWFVPE